MLVTLENKPYANMTIPGKVQSYMAAGKPIIGAINGSCSNFIFDNKIGYCCPSENSEALAKLILNLSLKRLIETGKCARQVYLNKYKKKFFMDKLLSVLKR